MNEKSTKLMKCGHAPNATDENGNPICIICHGIIDGADAVDNDEHDIHDRTARCTYHSLCKHEERSRIGLPFFKHKEEEEYDEYYCGCFGWD